MIETIRFTNSKNSPDVLSGEFAWRAAENEPAAPAITLAGQPLGRTAELQALNPRHLSDILGMPGSYVTLLRTAGSLSIAADMTGQFPVYYRAGQETLQYSTSVNELAAKTSSLQPDRIALADGILASVSGLYHTEYSGIRQIPAGHYLQATKGGIKLCRYFSPGDTTRQSYKETAEQLREDLHEAIDRRISTDGIWGSDFSGGYDCTALAFLAARYLPPTRQLEGIHQRHAAAITGDLAYAQAYAKLSDRVRIHYNEVPAGKLYSDPEAMRTLLEATELPAPLLPHAGAISHYLEFLQNLGITDQISGDGGDALFTPSDLFLADLYRDKLLVRPLYFLRQLFSVAQAGYVSPLQAFAHIKHVARTTGTPAASRQMFARYLEGSTTTPPPHYDVDVQALSLLRPGMRHELAQALLAQAEEESDQDPGIANRLALQELESSGRAIARFREIASRFGIAYHAPFLDHKIIQTVLSLSADRRTDLTQFKPLIRDALGADVPGPIFERRTKGSGNDGAYRGAARHADHLHDLLSRSPMLGDLGVIEPAKVRAAINRFRLGLEAPRSGLAYAMAAELWLRKIHGFDDTRGAAYGEFAAARSKDRGSTTEANPEKLPDWTTGGLRVSEYVRIARDELATVSYNLQTHAALTLDRASHIVLRSLQKQGNLNEARQNLQAAYPTASQAEIAAQLSVSLASLRKHGTLQSGVHRPFEIATANRQSDDSWADFLVHPLPVSGEQVAWRDYAAMGRQLIKALRMTTELSLYDIVTRLQPLKAELPYSTPSRVRSLVDAGHRLNRYVGKAVCKEITIAVILAEARRGRRVDFALGMGDTPRQFDAWPAVNGIPVQAAYGQNIEGHFIPFDIW